MKKSLIPSILLLILLTVIIKLDDITDFAAKIVSARPEVTIDLKNEYAYDNDYYYVSKDSDFVPYSKQDLMNIFYSILDNGYDTFTFYCPSEYTECLKDVEDFTNNQTVITDIGNYVHPYNNFSSLKVVTDSLGEVDVIVTRTYTDDMKRKIDDRLDEILKKVTTEDMDIYDKILKVHDYVIDNVVYDMEDTENSGNAYGALIEGQAKCAGYADAMAIVLAKLGIKNFKVASEKHVWNALFLDDEWSQIDLTWDDPVVQDGATVSDTIRHKFFMIDTETLMSYQTKEHDFDQSVYIELRSQK